ncbi:MAG: hypothetical protein QM768_20305 [Agriterribacter sp.]
MANNNLLQRFEQTLLQVHPAVVKRLNSGLPVDEIDKIALSYQLAFTEDVYHLFTWKNGIRHETANTTDELLLFPKGIPFSLLEAAHDYDLLSVTKHFFETSYFPLFSAGNEDILLINLDAYSPVYKMISLYSAALFGNETPVTVYDSFSSMLQTVIEGYGQKALWIEDDSLQVNDNAYHSIAAGLNPGSAFWNYM